MQVDDLSKVHPGLRPSYVLLTEKKFKTYELILDFRQKNISPFSITRDEDAIVRIIPPPVAAAGVKPIWRRLHLKYMGAAISAEVDGVTVHQSLELGRVAREGSVGISPGNGATDFANIYIKPLP